MTTTDTHQLKTRTLKGAGMEIGTCSCGSWEIECPLDVPKRAELIDRQHQRHRASHGLQEVA